MPGQSTATTRLRPWGSSGQQYGSFTKSSTAGSRAGQGPFTRITGAGPARRNGSFAGKVEPTSDTKTSSHSLIPKVTIGDVTDVDIDVTHALIPRLTMSSVVQRNLAAAHSLIPRVTMSRGAVTSSSISRSSAHSLIPVLTQTYALNRPQIVAHSLIPVLTMSSVADDTLMEAASDHSLIPVVTMASVLSETDKSAAHSLIPVLTHATQVQRFNATVAWDIPHVLMPVVTMSSTVRETGDVDHIEIRMSPKGYIEITKA
jgi:hypothetical protein